MPFWIFPVRGENGLGWPQMGPGGFFPTNPDLADILGRTDLDFENLYFFHFLDPQFLDFQVPRFPKSGPGQAWAGPGQARLGLGQAKLVLGRARLEPSGPKNVDFLS